MATNCGPLVLERTTLLGEYPRLYTLATMPSRHWSPDPYPHGRTGDDRLQGKTILLVDDEALVVNVGQHILEDAGYRVMTTASGEEALELYLRQGNEIDLVILDYVMPGMNGFQTWRKLAEINPEVRVLFWSGYLADKEVARLVTESQCDFIAKPYQIADLLEKVRRLLEKGA